MSKVMTFHVHQGGQEYQVEAKISGKFEKQTRHHPGGTPTVEIQHYSPPYDDFDRQYAKEEIIETLDRMRDER